MVAGLLYLSLSVAPKKRKDKLKLLRLLNSIYEKVYYIFSVGFISISYCF